MIYYVFQTEEPTEGITVSVKQKEKDLIAAIQDNFGGYMDLGFSFRAKHEFVQIDWDDNGTTIEFCCVPLKIPVKGYELSYTPDTDPNPDYMEESDVQWGLHEA